MVNKLLYQKQIDALLFCKQKSERKKKRNKNRTRIFTTLNHTEPFVE